MKSIMKFSVLMYFIALILGCGNDANSQSKQNDADKQEATCKGKNEIAVTIKKDLSKTGTLFEYSTGNFEVKSSSYTWRNDSLAELKLSNYETKDLVGDRKDDQIDLNITFKTKNGEKLSPGYYGYQLWKESKHSKATLKTSKGVVYFNWSNGMPKQGGVTIDNINKKEVCGSFNLNVDNQKAKFIGTVRLNGNFVCKK